MEREINFSCSFHARMLLGLSREFGNHRTKPSAHRESTVGEGSMRPEEVRLAAWC